jgi:putative ABC transport system permease protein
MIFISTAAADSFFDRGGEFDGYYVITENPDLNDQVRQELLDTYGSDLIIVSPQMIANTIQQITNGIYLFINVVAMVSLLVASVGIVTTIQTSMMERVKEIGLLKALGFNRMLTLELFLFEAAIIGIIGGSIGVLLGMGLSYGMSALLARGFQFSDVPGFTLQIVPSFNVQNLVSTWFLCVALSLISGFYPSWRASRLHPVEALRHE